MERAKVQRKVSLLLGGGVLCTALASAVSAQMDFDSADMQKVCPDVHDVRPLLIYNVSGATLLGPTHLQLTVLSNGFSSLSTMDFSDPQGSVTQVVLQQEVVSALAKDLEDAGAAKLCDDFSVVYDAPLATLTTFTSSDDGMMSHTVNYYPALQASPWSAVEYLIQQFISFDILSQLERQGSFDADPLDVAGVGSAINSQGTDPTQLGSGGGSDSSGIDPQPLGSSSGLSLSAGNLSGIKPQAISIGPRDRPSIDPRPLGAPDSDVDEVDHQELDSSDDTQGQSQANARPVLLDQGGSGASSFDEVDHQELDSSDDTQGQSQANARPVLLDQGGSGASSSARTHPKPIVPPIRDRHSIGPVLIGGGDDDDDSGPSLSFKPVKVVRASR